MVVFLFLVPRAWVPSSLQVSARLLTSLVIPSGGPLHKLAPLDISDFGPSPDLCYVRKPTSLVWFAQFPLHVRKEKKSREKGEG